MSVSAGRSSSTAGRIAMSGIGSAYRAGAPRLIAAAAVSRQETGERVRVQVPSKQSGESHGDSARRRHERQPVQPRLVRQRRQREERNRQSDQGVREVELVIAVIQAIVRPLILFGLLPQLL